MYHIISFKSFSDYPCPPFKLIILDEADSLTSDAQTALRRTIEQYSRSTRFCLICNYVSRIIDPLTSRCAKFRFGPVDPCSGIQRLKFICSSENVKFSSNNDNKNNDASVQDEVLLALMDRCGGDLRRGITLLQGAHRLGKPLSIDLIDNLAGTIPLKTLQDSFNIFTDPSITPLQIKSFVIEYFARSALPSTQFLHQFVPFLLNNSSTALPTASSLQIALILEMAAKVEARIGDGADEIIQILDFFMSLRLILHPNEFKQTLSLL